MRAAWLASLITDTIYLAAGAWRAHAVGSPWQRALARRRYAALAPRYDATVVPLPGYFAALETALAKLPDAPALALDVSTGTGAVLGPLRRRFPTCRVVAADLSTAMLAQAVRNVGGSGMPVRFLAGDAARLPFGDGRFDLVTVQNAFPVPRELVRVVRPGGWIVLCYPTGALVPTRIVRALVQELEDLGCAPVHTGTASTGRFFLARRAGPDATGGGVALW
ncbi:MAG: class I SAM-dependent methyltransferase [Armatimonadota bacterium]|nr:class I SAM-dependent methyltransferase [Armatimonadota bacterium]MDR7421301.1 class I SAM-dependent methyltransferase [Armatimonadota bacterium]MDR7455149.1 class I SAM-dependent methyltransferase [Armatimonadota bacterium]MDR7455776.1 class I SAM-dependent methyltransferase [Armatimonadota bacterium]MDR7496440.1 class I SAM-dependent methyltransferase [Armatimonadota bacterium]